MSTVVTRSELAAFLRSRRERVGPEEVGLPAGGRRRTPGLRREEVAQLAQVGVTWYTWLEQGRPINASAAVLQAIAGALRLDPGETAHLFTLAGTAPRTATGATTQVDPATRMVLDALDPVPACLSNARLDVIAQNRASALLFGDVADLPVARRNNLWLGFTEPRWRAMMVDWAEETAHMMALFRSALAEHLGEPDWEDLVDELSVVSPEFRAGWAEHQVALPGGRTKRFDQPGSGLLLFRTTSQWLQPRAGTRMIVYCPVDVRTERELERRRRSDLKPFVDWSDLTRYGRAALPVTVERSA